jgi:uncharacterized membrane protein YeaQ/YmgE (transglycosylase-associated protein family)
MTDHTPDKRSAFSRLTIESAIYGLILILAIALRLGGLQIRAMGETEAHQALQAWHLVQGETPGQHYSPLLLSGQALLFALFGASDTIARFLPALVGSALVLLPLALRSYLGRFGALGASLALALSPTLVYDARNSAGATLLIGATGAFLALWLAHRRRPSTRMRYAMSIVAALLLLADPRVIGVSIAAALAWAVERLAFKREWRATDQAIPWKTLGLFFSVTLVLAATALSINASGLAAWADYPIAWAAHLEPVVNGRPWFYPPGALLLYEPLILLLGAVGAVDLIANRDKLTFVVWMALGLLVLAMLAGGRGPGDIALVCFFLALCAGRTVQRLAESWQQGYLRREGLYVLIGLGISVYVAFEASFYAFALFRNLEQAGQFLWFWLLATALVVILLGLMLAWYGSELTWRTAGMIAAIVLALNAFSATTSLNFRHANDPREIHIWTATDLGVRDALDVMADLSFHQRGHPKAASVTVEAAVGPVWQWYLRDWEDVRTVEQITSDVDTTLVLASAAQEHPPLGDQYTGQDFVARTWWQPSQLVLNDRISWWLYRKSINNPQVTQRVILWLRAGQTA